MVTVQNIDVQNKKVLVRADLNIGQNFDDFRIKVSLPTIKYLLKNKAKIILMAHLDRPGGKIVEKLRLNLVQEKLSKYLGLPVKKAPDCIGREVEELVNQIQAGEILLLENLRFHPEEENNDRDFARQLAKLGDIYINDAFGVCHRCHASVVAITEFLPSAAGLLLEKEIKILNDILEKPKRPLVVVIGGVKISTKIKLIENFLEKADGVILGGALANTVLQAQGIAIGKSIFEKEVIPKVQELELTNPKLHIPVDVIASVDKSGEAENRVAPVGKISQDEMILDIGPDTEKLFSEVIDNAQTVVWNGPMGLFEVEAFSHGTKAIAQTIASSRSFSVVGGGETVAYLNKIGLLEKFKHVSSGGGAMLAFLAEEELPGLKALNYYQKY